MKANYAKYLTLFPVVCKGTPVQLTDARLIAHVYGWTPFTEVATSGPGLGCGAKANLLEDTPGYFTINPNKTRNYAEYQRVKTLFDKLNYGPLIKVGPLTDQKYIFNPWVQLVHGPTNLDAPNAYAYSVDDAVGNIQAEGLGFIVDVGSTINLENQNLASPPINVGLGFSLADPIRFTHYRLCSNVPGRDKRINPRFPAFIINANNPERCPVFLYDNKAPEQLYTFKITQKPPFKFIANPAVTPPVWDPQTAKPIDCTGNTGVAPYKPSSKTWCCNLTAKAGVYAYSTPEPHNAHKSMLHIVQTRPAERTTGSGDVACSGGK